MRSFALSVLVASLLCGCPSEPFVPSGEDTRDFRVTFSSSEASESCGQSVQDESNNFEEFSQIYRVWWPNGIEDSSFEVWWRLDSQADEELSFFARGSMEGLLNQGVLIYAGGPFTEGRSDGDVRYTIEGQTVIRFEEELFGGSEQYIISDSSSSEAPAGCVYILSYGGQLISEQPGTDE